MSVDALRIGALTPRRVPEAYVRMEVASFPLTSIASFRAAAIELRPFLDEKGEKKTANMWRECERLMSEHGSGWSLDRLLATRDAFWFECSVHSRLGEHAPEPLHCYLRRLAKRYLERRAAITQVVESRRSVVEAMMSYRWLTFAVPEDLLLAATGVRPAPTRVDVDPPLVVRRLLDRGVAEIHQHVNAGMDFPTLWVSTLAALADPKLSPEALSGPGLVFEDSETTLRWLLAAAVARSVLTEYLLSGAEDLRSYVEECRFSENACRPWRLREGQWRLVERVLTALSFGDEEPLPKFYPLRDLYQEMHREGYLIATESPPETVDEVWRRCDPISVRLSLDAQTSGESWFVESALSRLESWEEQGERKRAGGAPFERVFWQIVRIRCLLYRTVVQRPMTAGLQWFIRFYQRLGPLRRPLQRARAELAYEIAGGEVNHSIAALEIRETPKDTSSAMAQDIQGLLMSWERVLHRLSRVAGGSEPEFGVVLHIEKYRDPARWWSRGETRARGMGGFAEPRRTNGVNLGGRYAEYFAEQSNLVRAVGDMLEALPAALWAVRGIDVAGDELGVPTWVLVPLFQNLVQRSRFAAAKCPPEWRPPPLRITAHVGEDYRHLMEGLRRIFECVHYLLKQPGSRLGHATALGVEPRLWAEETGSVMMPMEDRLWDLVFEWRLYSRFRVADELRTVGPSERIHWVESQIRELSHQIFQTGMENESESFPSIMAAVHDELHEIWSAGRGPRREILLGLSAFNWQIETLVSPRRPDGERPPCPSAALRLLKRYLMDQEVFRRGQKLIDVALDTQEVEALYAIQNAMRRCVEARSIVVEINPSSNLLIGNLLDLRNHPTLRLYPPEPEEGAPPRVPIALGSDDPITFSTNCLHEYSLLFGAALSAGYEERSVIRWLEEIQRTSMDARFTLAWRPSAKSKAAWLVDQFDRYLQTSSTATMLRERRRRLEERRQAASGPYLEEERWREDDGRWMRWL